jgi:polysaccharide biosynthesis transport protein
MSDKKQDSVSGGVSLQDVYFILFRQKWIILIFSLIGLLAAAAVCILKPPQYRSEAELSVRYMVEEKSLNAPGDEARPLDERSDSIIKTEVEILTSLDLAEQVVQVVTAERILAKEGGGSDTNRAAYIVSKGLSVDTAPASSLIRIAFQHPDPELVQPALNTIIDTYFTRHFQIHQGVGRFGDFLTNEIARLRTELDQTEKNLRDTEANSHVISTVEDARKAYSDQISKLREDIFSVKADLDEHQAMVSELENNLTVRPDNTNAEPTTEVPSDKLDAYKQICLRLETLEKKDMDYLMQGFTDENVLVKEVRGQIADVEKQKIDLEEKYPKLAGSAIAVPILTGQQPGNSMDFSTLDLPTQHIQIAALKSKLNSLESQLNQVWLEVTNFEKVDATISELQQKKQVEESNLNYFESNLERNRIDTALGDGKASNISIIQSPTPPVKGWSKKFKKKVLMVAVGGIGFGLSLAFLIEMLLDRSVRQPSEIESRLRLPLYVTIPDTARNAIGQIAGRGRLQLSNGVADANAKTAVPIAPAPWDRQHPLRPYYQGLRDRLMVYFETNNLNHKPKLVALTSCGGGAGVSSIAAGLAASLSETGDGNVLLVSMTGNQESAQQFYKGQTGCGLDDALESKTKKDALVEGNFYAVTEQAGNEKVPTHLPKRLKALMPKLKASDYDYIIFDMPPVSQISPTPKLAQFMDMVFMVVESEKTDRDVVKRATDLLAESKTHVGIVLNKSHNYVPRRLLQEL